MTLEYQEQENTKLWNSRTHRGVKSGQKYIEIALRRHADDGANRKSVHKLWCEGKPEILVDLHKFSRAEQRVNSSNDPETYQQILEDDLIKKEIKILSSRLANMLGDPKAADRTWIILVVGSFGIKFSMALTEIIHKRLKSEMTFRTVNKKHLTEENITTDFPGKPDERWTKNERYKKHVIRVVHYYLWYGIMGKFQDVLHSNKNKPKKGARPPEPSQPPGEGRQQEKSQRETTPGYKRHAEIMDRPD